MAEKKIEVLIIGGSGFIGRHLVKAVLKKGWKVFSASLHIPNKTKRIKKVKYIKVDLKNYLDNLKDGVIKKYK